ILGLPVSVWGFLSPWSRFTEVHCPGRRQFRADRHNRFNNLRSNVWVNTTRTVSFSSPLNADWQTCALRSINTTRWNQKKPSGDASPRSTFFNESHSNIVTFRQHSVVPLPPRYRCLSSPTLRILSLETASYTQILLVQKSGRTRLVTAAVHTPVHNIHNGRACIGSRRA
ncbi:hypothetical protein C8R46DRAFT_1192661, partial [Mycena filopes]